jgi:hypothetical protein
VSEPQVDEAAFQRAQRLIKLTALRGTPMDGDRCGNCGFYLAPDEPLAFCWQEKLQTLVGADWWCQHWTMIEEDA